MTTMTTVPTRRIAFTSIPTASPVIQGTGGVGLRANFLPGIPTATRSDGAVAFPMFQPELGLLVKVGKSSYVGGRTSVSGPSLGLQAPRDSVTPEPRAFSFEVTAGGGHDFRFTDVFGLSLSGELGLSTTSVTRTAAQSRLTNETALPVGRGTVGLFLTQGNFRFYAGGTVGSTVLNDAAGTLTTTCQFDCVVSETGRLDLTVAGMVGGGVRWQANEQISLAAEAWLPLSPIQRMPPVLSVTVRLGDLGNSPRPPKPLPPPPPPPSVTPEPEPVPLQL